MKLKIDLESGLHDKANQKRFSDPKLTAQISEFLLEENHLQRLCEVSRCKAPIRKSYLKELTRSQTVLPAHQEARLERAVWATWRPYFHKTRDRCVLPGDPFAEDISYIATYQLALFNAKEREGWGHVDLVGISSDCTPVVIELKAGGSTESPLRPILEAACYGICIQRAWEDKLKSDWNCLLARFKMPAVDKLEQVRLVCAAPQAYWCRWRKELTPEAWRLLGKICGQLELQKMPVRFLNVNFTTSPADMSFSSRSN